MGSIRTPLLSTGVFLGAPIARSTIADAALGVASACIILGLLAVYVRRSKPAREKTKLGWLAGSLIGVGGGVLLVGQWLAGAQWLSPLGPFGPGQGVTSVSQDGQILVATDPSHVASGAPRYVVDAAVSDTFDVTLTIKNEAPIQVEFLGLTTDEFQVRTQGFAVTSVRIATGVGPGGTPTQTAEFSPVRLEPGASVSLSIHAAIEPCIAEPDRPADPTGGAIESYYPYRAAVSAGGLTMGMSLWPPFEITIQNLPSCS